MIVTDPAVLLIILQYPHFRLFYISPFLPTSEAEFTDKFLN